MKKNVEVKAGGLKFVTKLQADNAISRYSDYGIKCKELDFEFGMSYKYKLLLEGEKSDIESYLGYLRMKGFKVKEF